jgi:hypothetical protein
MLPASATDRPARLRISAIHAVVVDLPLVPVIATQRLLSGDSASAMRYAISTSARTGMPRSRAAATGGAVNGTPGETASQSAPSRNSAPESPRKNRTPRRRSSSTPESFSSGCASATVTETPRSTSASDRARPLRAKPSTAIRCGRGWESSAARIIGNALIAASTSRAPALRRAAPRSRTG